MNGPIILLLYAPPAPLGTAERYIFSPLMVVSEPPCQRSAGSTISFMRMGDRLAPTMKDSLRT